MDAVPVTALFEELSRRPDIEAVDTRYRELLASLRDRLVAEVGLAPWVPAARPVNASVGRGRFAKLGGAVEIRRYSSGHAPGAVPDSDWQRAVAIVATAAAAYGFVAPTVVVDRPGDHEIAFAGEYGGELLFGTATNTTLSLTTGCHLTREAYLRGPTASRTEPTASRTEPTASRTEPTASRTEPAPSAGEDQRRPPAPRNPAYRPAPTVSGVGGPVAPESVDNSRGRSAGSKRRREEAVEEDFDTLEFVRKRKRT